MPLASRLSAGTPDLASMELLVAVADEGGIGAAARALGLSQPTASERLRLLERRVGLTLVRRRPEGSVLTDDGERVAEWARTVLGSAAERAAGVAGLKGEARLSVTASLTVAEHLVPGWLVALGAEAPPVTVVVRMGNSEAVVADVRAGRADLGFIEGASTPRGLRLATITRDELALVVAPDHPWARSGRPRTAADLAATPLVMRETGSGTREVLERWLAREGLAPRPAVVLASTHALAEAVRSGVGPGVVSGLAVRGDVASGRLVAVGLADAAGRRVRLDRRVRAVWRGPGDPSPPAARLLAVALRGQRDRAPSRASLR